MKYLVGCTTTEAPSVFAVIDQEAVNLTALEPRIGADLTALMADPSLGAALGGRIAQAPRVALSRITPALPVANPGAIICLGLNYADHIKEGGYNTPTYPAFFLRGRRSIMAAGAPMVRPICSEELDYEAELMLVIGKGGRHIPEAEALSHVFGYTIFNDGSVRDYQFKGAQWTPGKNFDNTGAVGPFVVTPEDLPEGAVGLNIQTRVGSEILQSSNTDNMIWTVAHTIATISQFTTLAPGDLIALGTPPGVGHAKQPAPRWLVPGETVEIEIEGIGICASPVLDETPPASA